MWFAGDIEKPHGSVAELRLLLFNLYIFIFDFWFFGLFHFFDSASDFFSDQIHPHTFSIFHFQFFFQSLAIFLHSFCIATVSTQLLIILNKCVFQYFSFFICEKNDFSQIRTKKTLFPRVCYVHSYIWIRCFKFIHLCEFESVYWRTKLHKLWIISCRQYKRTILLKLHSDAEFLEPKWNYKFFRKRKIVQNKHANKKLKNKRTESEKSWKLNHRACDWWSEAVQNLSFPPFVQRYAHASHRTAHHNTDTAIALNIWQMVLVFCRFSCTLKLNRGKLSDYIQFSSRSECWQKSQN